jgi:putative spermidine/putrescine transport system ATP-binding protein
MPAAIAFQEVCRNYGNIQALDRVSFSVQEGEFFSMLGPSGSGKTTSLRLMAGFEQASSGTLSLFGQAVSGTPAYARDVNTVFQDYALFGHMTVLDNVAYGLMVRKVPKPERYALAREALEMVALPDHAGRMPAQLSGGQRQRVALARALVNRPRILLLDEPLGALDMKLREKMQVELKLLHRKLGITFIYVTHDQGEALSMSDRVAVFNQGRIEQIAAPRDLYHRPKTRFVADFVGSSNVFEGEIAQLLSGRPQDFSVRQENMLLCPPSGSLLEGYLKVQAEVIAVQFLGATQKVELQLRTLSGLQTVTALQQEGLLSAGANLHIGQTITLQWAPEHMVMLDA